LWRDRRVALWPRIVPLAALAYVLVPFDLLADPMLGLGQVDDLSVVVLAVRLFVALCPTTLVAQHRRALAGEAATPQAADGEVVDATYRVLDDSRSWARASCVGQSLRQAHAPTTTSFPRRRESRCVGTASEHGRSVPDGGAVTRVDTQHTRLRGDNLDAVLSALHVLHFLC
jgi:uncharacterized membrane protein YkvA (DUF1232 family)